MLNLDTKISRSHSNRKLHNWLAYDISDRFLLKHRPLYRGAIYDLGCGESPYREFFLRFADEYIGVDWAGSIHDTSTDVTADLNRPLPIMSNVADTVISLSVMEHLYEPQQMLNEAYRILKSDGRLVLQVPWQWLVHEAPHDFFRYTPYGLTYMLEKSGFMDIEVESQSGFFTTWTMKFNYFTLRILPGPKPIRLFALACVAPFWWLGQVMAPILDRLDQNWALEASGYFVTARKP